MKLMPNHVIGLDQSRARILDSERWLYNNLYYTVLYFNVLCFIFSVVYYIVMPSSVTSKMCTVISLTLRYKNGVEECYAFFRVTVTLIARSIAET